MIDVTDADNLVKQELCDADFEYTRNTLFHRVQLSHFEQLNPGMKTKGFYVILCLAWKLVDVMSRIKIDGRQRQKM